VELLNAMNDSATNFPAHVSEFDAAHVLREPSVTVAAPRVASAPIVFECRAAGEHEIGDCVMVFGEVLHIATAAGVLASDGLPDAAAVAPLARLGRAQWATLGEIIDLKRIRYDDWQQGKRSG
jgi:flavin reductase (DIM6/NTAB) family NADH-FMN oxidoreductase RutF